MKFNNGNYEEVTYYICDDCEEKFDDEDDFDEHECYALDIDKLKDLSRKYEDLCDKIERRTDYPDSRVRRPLDTFLPEWLGCNSGKLEDPEYIKDIIPQLEAWANGIEPLPERHPSAEIGPASKLIKEPPGGNI